MKVYGSNAIRNVAFVGHGASGKTSLVDALAFVSGTSRRHGSIKDGTTLTDYLPTKSNANTPSTWPRLRRVDGYQDQSHRYPGYLDFFGEVICGLVAAMRPSCVLSGRGGRGGNREILGSLRSLHLPRVLFVSLMDKEHANFERVFNDMKAHLTPKVLPVEIPSATATSFAGSSIFLPTCHLFKPGRRPASTGRFRFRPIPGPFPAVCRADDRSRGGHRRRAYRALPGGPGDLAGCFHPGDQAGRDRGRHRAALLRQRRADLAPARCSRRWSSCSPRPPK